MRHDYLRITSKKMAVYVISKETKTAIIIGYL
ncbi:hypothetical protein GJS26_01176 [Pectobacterium carotovorum subsp. carotovorum]|nr:hypothetical protein [Pectobacterium carotovorum subsp. carotovorum]